MRKEYFLPDAYNPLWPYYPIRCYKAPDGTEIATLSWNEIQAQNTPFLRESISLFRDWKRFSILPNGRGTRGERNSVIQILRILDEEDFEWNEWERDKRMAERKGR